jgi:deazaflavin-dependent oxidoreductase (nitroreductase family)
VEGIRAQLRLTLGGEGRGAGPLAPRKSSASTAPPPVANCRPPATTDAEYCLTVAKASAHVNLTVAMVKALADAGKLTKIPAYYGSWYMLRASEWSPRTGHWRDQANTTTLVHWRPPTQAQGRGQDGPRTPVRMATLLGRMSVELTPGGTRGVKMPGGPLKKVFAWLSVTAHRVGLGRRIDDRPVVLLTTRGAHSGVARTTPVLAFPQGNDAWLIVASAGGAARHPDWFVNIARNPQEVWIEVEGRKLQVTPRSLSGPEREEAWRQIVAASPRFGGYEQKTDREMPVVRLSATG